MAKKQVSVKELADLVQGKVVGDGSQLIDELASVETAGENQITFLVKVSEPEILNRIQAAAVIVPLEVESSTKTLIQVANPYLASAIIHNFLLETPFEATGIHKSSYVGVDCSISDKIRVDPLVAIGDRVKIGERVHIYSGVVIGDDVEIGDDTVIRPNVTIEYGSKIGKRVIIHSGTVVGSDGYGYAPNEIGCHIKRPQVGIVRIDDDVEIGANCCFDRAAYSETWIKSGTKIDNMVHIAHNVVVGENCLLLSHVAIAGSTTLGRNVVMGGKASAKGHIHLSDGVMVAGKGGVTRNQSAGAIVGGMPAIPIKDWTKSATAFGKIPDMRTEIRRLRKELTELKQSVIEKE